MLGHTNIVFKRDSGPVSVALKHAIEAECSEEISMEEPCMGESASNGEVEHAIRQVEGHSRIIKSSVEGISGEKLACGHMCILWLSWHAAELMDRFSVGTV